MSRVKKRPLTPNGENSMLKMKELVSATGVTKPTITHYVNEGLLPKPVKTSANMAYYDQACIERIIYIKKLQSSHRLGLAQIKIILEQRDKDKEVTPLIELWETVFDPSAFENADKLAFSRLTGLSMEEVEESLTQGLLVPRRQDQFDPEDIVIGKVIRKAIDIGVSPKDAVFYPHFAKKIVEKEMTIRERIIKDQPLEEAISLTMELTRIARSLRAYVIDREFQKMAIKQEI